MLSLVVLLTICLLIYVMYVFPVRVVAGPSQNQGASARYHYYMLLLFILTLLLILSSLLWLIIVANDYVCC